MVTRGKVKFIEKDTGWEYIKSVARELGRKPYVAVGVRGAKAQEKKTFVSEDGGKAQSISNPVTLVDVATIHEYGAPGAGIPERSFIRSTVDKNLSGYKQLLKDLQLQLFNPASPITVRSALMILGEKIKLDIQATIRAGIPPPWAPSTREARIRRANPEGGVSVGKDGVQGATIIAETPLIDTGQLVGGISYGVEYMKGGK